MRQKGVGSKLEDSKPSRSLKPPLGSSWSATSSWSSSHAKLNLNADGTGGTIKFLLSWFYATKFESAHLFYLEISSHCRKRDTYLEYTIPSSSWFCRIYRRQWEVLAMVAMSDAKDQPCCDGLHLIFSVSCTHILLPRCSLSIPSNTSIAGRQHQVNRTFSRGTQAPAASPQRLKIPRFRLAGLIKAYDEGIWIGDPWPFTTLVYSLLSHAYAHHLWLNLRYCSCRVRVSQFRARHPADASMLRRDYRSRQCKRLLYRRAPEPGRCDVSQKFPTYVPVCGSKRNSMPSRRWGS